MVQPNFVLTQEDIYKLVSLNGFYEVYFRFLPNFTKSEDAFDFLNDLYMQTYGQPRFKTYSSFKVQGCKKRVKKGN